VTVAGKAFKCPSCGASLEERIGQESTVECGHCGTQVVVPEDLRPQDSAAADARRSSSEGNSVLGCIVAGIIGLVVFGGGAAISIFQESAERRKRDVPVPPFERPLETSLPREVRYAGLTVQVRKGTITNRIPDSDSSSLRTSANEAYATLDVALHNPLTTDPVLLEDAVRLQLADGRISPARDSLVQLQPQSNDQGTFLFTVPFDATWKGAKLVLAGKNREPAVLPLEGPVPAPAYPVQLASGAEVRVADVSYRILSAILDLDSHGERAEQGRRFLTLQMRVTNHSTFSGGLGVSEEHFRLLVDGLAIAPSRYPIELLAATSYKDCEIVFNIPAATAQADLQVGVVGKETTRIPLPPQSTDKSSEK
jgi:DNA-directed RNA polymerase subunit RPC12/RpoP